MPDAYRTVLARPGPWLWSRPGRVRRGLAECHLVVEAVRRLVRVRSRNTAAMAAARAAAAAIRMICIRAH